MPRERFRHLFLDGPEQVRDFSSPRRGGSSPRLRPQHRQNHAEYLSQRLREAWVAAETRQAVAHADRRGIYLEFFSEPGFDLVLKSLESRRSGIIFLNVRTEGPQAEQTTKAIVSCLDRKAAIFCERSTHTLLKKISGLIPELVRPSPHPRTPN